MTPLFVLLLRVILSVLAIVLVGPFLAIATTLALVAIWLVGKDRL